MIDTKTSVSGGVKLPAFLFKWIPTWALVLKLCSHCTQHSGNHIASTQKPKDLNSSHRSLYEIPEMLSDCSLYLMDIKG